MSAMLTMQNAGPPKQLQIVCPSRKCLSSQTPHTLSSWQQFQYLEAPPHPPLQSLNLYPSITCSAEPCRSLLTIPLLLLSFLFFARLPVQGVVPHSKDLGRMSEFEFEWTTLNFEFQIPIANSNSCLNVIAEYDSKLRIWIHIIDLRAIVTSVKACFKVANYLINNWHSLQ